MCFAFDARPPDLPADLVHPRMAGGAGAEKLELTSADGTVFSAALAESAEAPRPRRDHPARRPGALPLLRRARRAVRRGRPSRDRDRLLRPHGRHRRARRRLGVHAPRRADAASRRSRPTPTRPGPRCRAHGRDELRDGRLLLRRHAVVPCRDEPGAHARRRGRLLRALAGGRFGCPPSSTTSARRAARSSASSAAPTRRSRRATSTPTTGSSRRPASSTRSSSTPARRTRSSTAPSRSTRARARTPGGASSGSSSRSARRGPRRATRSGVEGREPSASSRSARVVARSRRWNGSRSIRPSSYRHVPATAPSTRNVGTDCGVFVWKIARPVGLGEDQRAPDVDEQRRVPGREEARPAPGVGRRSGRARDVDERRRRPRRRSAAAPGARRPARRVPAGSPAQRATSARDAGPNAAR